MSDPAIGAYGVAVTACVLLLRFAALASMQPSILLIAGAWCGSRTVMAVAARALPYARAEGGLATVMLGGDWKPVGLYGVIAAVSLGAFAGGRRTEIAVAAGLVASAAVVLFARRRLGGFTGDVLGAAGIVGETVALVVAAADMVNRPLAVACRTGGRRDRRRTALATAPGRGARPRAAARREPRCIAIATANGVAHATVGVALGVAAGAATALDGARDVSRLVRSRAARRRDRGRPTRSPRAMSTAHAMLLPALVGRDPEGLDEKDDLPRGGRVGGREHGGRDRRSRAVGAGGRCARRDRAPRREHDGLHDRSPRRALRRVRVGRGPPRRRRGVGPGQGRPPRSWPAAVLASPVVWCASCGAMRRRIPRPTPVSPRPRSRPRSTCDSAARTVTATASSCGPCSATAGRPNARDIRRANRLSRDVTLALAASLAAVGHRAVGAAVIPAPGAHGGDGPADRARARARPRSRRRPVAVAEPVRSGGRRVGAPPRATRCGTIRTSTTRRRAAGRRARRRSRAGAADERRERSDHAGRARARRIGRRRARVLASPARCRARRGGAAIRTTRPGSSPTTNDTADVWDEAFYPLATGTWTRGDEDAVVVGSLTKVFACPGLRLGYVLADDAVAVRVRPAGVARQRLGARVVAGVARARRPRGVARRHRVRRGPSSRRCCTTAATAPLPSDAPWLLVEAPGAARAPRAVRHRRARLHQLRPARPRSHRGPGRRRTGSAARCPALRKGDTMTDSPYEAARAAVSPVDEAAARSARAHHAPPHEAARFPRTGRGPRRATGCHRRRRSTTDPGTGRRSQCSPGDHGVVAEGVTPWPQEVTGQMVANFVAGGAAINVLARQAGATVTVVDVGVATDLDALGLADASGPPAPRRCAPEPPTWPCRAGDDGRRSRRRPATSVPRWRRSWSTGGARALVTGEMGIGNTTAAAAVIAALTGRPAGAGHRPRHRHRRRAPAAEDRGRRSGGRPAAHRRRRADAGAVLAEVGGLEIAALAGFIVGGAAQRVPVVVDGVIAGAALLAAIADCADVLPYVVAGHRSTEPGASAVLEHLGLEPVIDLGLRLGEGSGACLGARRARSVRPDPQRDGHLRRRRHHATRIERWRRTRGC